MVLADIVLIDSPPVLAAPDSAILGRHATGTVVVASGGQTSRDHLERAIHRLEATHCHVLGIAINRVKRTSGSYRRLSLQAVTLFPPGGDSITRLSATAFSPTGPFAAEAEAERPGFDATTR